MKSCQVRKSKFNHGVGSLFIFSYSFHKYRWGTYNMQQTVPGRYVDGLGVVLPQQHQEDRGTFTPFISSCTVSSLALHTPAILPFFLSLKKALGSFLLLAFCTFCFLSYPSFWSLRFHVARHLFPRSLPHTNTTPFPPEH